MQSGGISGCLCSVLWSSGRSSCFTRSTRDLASEMINTAAEEPNHRSCGSADVETSIHTELSRLAPPHRKHGRRSQDGLKQGTSSLRSQNDSWLSTCKQKLRDCDTIRRTWLLPANFYVPAYDLRPSLLFSDLWKPSLPRYRTWSLTVTLMIIISTVISICRTLATLRVTTRFKNVPAALIALPSSSSAISGSTADVESTFQPSESTHGFMESRMRRLSCCRIFGGTWESS